MSTCNELDEEKIVDDPKRNVTHHEEECKKIADYTLLQ